jgi:hypothetical protein
MKYHYILLDSGRTIEIEKEGLVEGENLLQALLKLDMLATFRADCIKDVVDSFACLHTEEAILYIGTNKRKVDAAVKRYLKGE